jgi:hypothetical protein
MIARLRKAALGEIGLENFNGEADAINVKGPRVSGVMWPHLAAYESDGRLATEYEIKSFKLIPAFAPDHFDPTEEKK